MGKLIELKDIYKTYFLGEIDVPVLKGITLDIEHGEYVALMGASGSGKSTLMNILGCLDRPTSGDYLLEGEELGRASGDRRAMIRNRKIGFVFQNFNLLPRTSALENVIMPLNYTNNSLSRSECRKRGLAALEQVGIADRAGHHPSQLSGGQQQRVAIARAWAMHPQVLCFDEPTSALDPELTGEVLRVIKGLKGEDRTMVVVTHEMEFAKQVADVVIYMADGIIEEMGTPQQVFESPQSEKTASFLRGALEKF